MWIFTCAVYYVVSVHCLIPSGTMEYKWFVRIWDRNNVFEIISFSANVGLRELSEYCLCNWLIHIDLNCFSETYTKITFHVWGMGNLPNQVFFCIDIFKKGKGLVKNVKNNLF